MYWKHQEQIIANTWNNNNEMDWTSNETNWKLAKSSNESSVRTLLDTKSIICILNAGKKNTQKRIWKRKQHASKDANRTTNGIQWWKKSWKWIGIDTNQYVFHVIVNVNGIEYNNGADAKDTFVWLDDFALFRISFSYRSCFCQSSHSKSKWI